MDGVLVIDKPAGPTSFDVVRRVRSLLKVKKAGHTGTLDPLATGVLPLCLGNATKVAGLIIDGDKAYDAVVRLGVETDTQDAAGKVIAEAPIPQLSKEIIEPVLSRFRGTFAQIPPMYSAVKIDGKRLYEHARAGEEVQRESRPVTVYELVLRDFSSSDLTLSLRCSKGFFVRQLASDLGKALGCGAHLKALRRTASGPFTLPQAIGLDKLIAAYDAGEQGPRWVREHLMSMSDALCELPAIVASDADVARVLHGVPIESQARPGRVRVLSAAGELLAVAEVQPDLRLKYLRVLASVHQ